MITAENSTVLRRNNVTVTGNPNGRPVIFAHGFGCSQRVWRHITPAFARDYKVVLFDHVGSGNSDPRAYDFAKYDSLHGYADDVVEIMDALELTDAVYVGHSVSAMIGVLASITDGSRFGSLILVGPSPKYINTGEYEGGFEHDDIHALLDELDSNHFGWSSTMAPLFMGNPDRPELGEELTENFCSTDPNFARHFARVTFLSDNRDDLSSVTKPTLILQSSSDIVSPAPVGRFVHEKISGSTLVELDAAGHIPNLSEPEELSAAILAYLS